MSIMKQCLLCKMQTILDYYGHNHHFIDHLKKPRTYWSTYIYTNCYSNPTFTLIMINYLLCGILFFFWVLKHMSASLIYLKRLMLNIPGLHFKKQMFALSTYQIWNVTEN